MKTILVAGKPGSLGEEFWDWLLTSLDAICAQHDAIAALSFIQNSPLDALAIIMAAEGVPSKFY